VKLRSQESAGVRPDVSVDVENAVSEELESLAAVKVWSAYEFPGFVEVMTFAEVIELSGENGLDVFRVNSHHCSLPRNPHLPVNKPIPSKTCHKGRTPRESDILPHEIEIFEPARSLDSASPRTSGTRRISQSVSQPKGILYGSWTGFAPNLANLARSWNTDEIYHPVTKTERNTSAGSEYIVSKIILLNLAVLNVGGRGGGGGGVLYIPTDGFIDPPPVTLGEAKPRTISRAS